MKFYEKLENIWKKNNSLICVGLDPDLKKIPKAILNEKYPIFEFNRRIIDSTADFVCSYKPQIAYYSAYGAENQLELTIKYLKDKYPEIPVILDAKRGDIGSTAEMYVKEVFNRYQADAVTVNPFMGGDTLKPFLDREDKGVVILCKTSNPGSDEIQGVKNNNLYIYEEIAKRAQNSWNYNNNIVLVVGATYPEEMEKIRKIAHGLPFLVPGIGAQGGDPEKVIKNGIRDDNYGLIISSSRGIIYAGMRYNISGEDFDLYAGEAAKKLKNLINKYRG